MELTSRPSDTVYANGTHKPIKKELIAGSYIQVVEFELFTIPQTRVFVLSILPLHRSSRGVHYARFSSTNATAATTLKFAESSLGAQSRNCRSIHPRD